MARQTYFDMFTDARIPLVAKSLSAKNRKKFLGYDKEKQRRVVAALVKRGVLI